MTINVATIDEVIHQMANAVVILPRRVMPVRSTRMANEDMNDRMKSKAKMILESRYFEKYWERRLNSLLILIVVFVRLVVVKNTILELTLQR